MIKHLLMIGQVSRDHDTSLQERYGTRDQQIVPVRMTRRDVVPTDEELLEQEHLLTPDGLSAWELMLNDRVCAVIVDDTTDRHIRGRRGTSLPVETLPGLEATDYYVDHGNGELEGPQPR